MCCFSFGGALRKQLPYERSRTIFDLGNYLISGNDCKAGASIKWVFFNHILTSNVLCHLFLGLVLLGNKDLANLLMSGFSFVLV